MNRWFEIQIRLIHRLKQHDRRSTIRAGGGCLDPPFLILKSEASYLNQYAQAA